MGKITTLTTVFALALAFNLVLVSSCHDGSYVPQFSHACSNVWPSTPDLTFSSVNYISSNCNKTTCNMVLNYTITNQGTGDAGPSYFRAYLTTLPQTNTSLSYMVQNFIPFISTEVPYIGQTFSSQLPRGDYILTLYSDYFNHVIESNETNNIKKLRIHL